MTPSLNQLLLILTTSIPFWTAAATPNVLILFADQHNADVMGCANHPIVKTPNLDQLAATGVRFTRAYCQDAVCVPSRTALMTGLYPRTTGCLDNGDSPVSQEKLYPLQQVFQSAGYLTGCFGKRHLPRPTLALGWTRSATVISPRQDPSNENYEDWIQTCGPDQAEAFAKDQKGGLQSDMCCHISDVKPEYAAIEAQLRGFLDEWSNSTPDAGKMALSATPAETKKHLRKAKP